MIPLFFVGDGDRDRVTVPRIVEAILGRQVLERTKAWPRLTGKKGYEHKLKFAVLQAQDARTLGLVATVDGDKVGCGGRLKKLQLARQKLRAHSPPFPTALGCAEPHLEAWLLDDPDAVRKAMYLNPSTPIPNVRDCTYPKRELEELLAQSQRSEESPLAVWPDIARQLNPERCMHARETGFEGFKSEVDEELRATLSGGSP